MLKTIVLADFGNITSRMLYSAISLAKPRKQNGVYITAEFAQIAFHLVLNSLKYTKKKFKADELVICLDGNGSWRKRVYPDYKGNRGKSSDINWDEWYVYLDQLITVIDESFPFKVIGYNEAEADDIIAIIAKELSPHAKIIVDSPDKDFLQLLKHPNLQLHDPMTKAFRTMNETELENWELEHVLIGDKIDNVPSVVADTEFSPNFLSYLKTNEIYTESVAEFEKLTIAEKLYTEYDVETIVKSGKLKGQKSGIKDVFKTKGFGPAACAKFSLDLEASLCSHPLYKRNYERNKKLVLFEYIPEDIYQGVLQEYANAQVHYSTKGINDFLMKYHLNELLANVSDFYVSGEESTSSLDDFF